ncbi:hypothetical protein Scep_028554 [Stephania cephalantha]|uniref:Uncharacterized protein n=1 Tax=Stephania cephalantha TaxID=152367 RepID=A0AAP0HLX5_9MAGN
MLGRSGGPGGHHQVYLYTHKDNGRFTYQIDYICSNKGPVSGGGWPLEVPTNKKAT